EHLLEAARSAIVGVGDVEVGGVAGGVELAQEVDLVARLLAGGEPAQDGHVFAIHRDQQVELFEVLLADRPCGSVERDATLPRRRGRARVGRAAYMPASRAARVDLDLALHTGLAQ